ncbi:hypothetical protein CANMA_000991 [Candida margitis]|uniref:uncharacterized protein n=1 Tax=Candida margitis TaxID=1775924 RepID=UPI002227B094|nr:uncharacterized protein CANMA_000991 [Candida margitis]KAI5969951.1 hypothetical protein CANMA_000991 [Candida margitis]
MKFLAPILLAAVLAHTANPSKDSSPTTSKVYSDKDCKDEIDFIKIEIEVNLGHTNTCYELTKNTDKYLDLVTFTHSNLEAFKDSDCKDKDGRGNKIPDYKECWEIPEGLHFKWFFITSDINNPLCCA